MTVILAILAGAGIGAGVAIVLYVLGFDVALIPVACIVGALIGLANGLYKLQAASEEEARRIAAAEEAKNQHIKWADEVKQKALSVANSCAKNAEDCKSIISPNYMAASQMDVIMKELANAAELKGKVDAMANDTKTKGGAFK